MSSAALADTSGTTESISARARLYPETRFGEFSRRDGTLAFYARVNALLTPRFRVLDYGCGVGAHIRELDPFLQALQTMRGKVAEVIGADVEEGSTNPYIDRFVAIKDYTVPLDTASIDLCICDWGVEHFDAPSRFVAECRRVLRPGGYLCIRTPNRLHYSSLGASILPFRYHQAVRRRLGQFHTADDVFPTHYRCNTRGRLRRTLEHHEFDAHVWSHRGDSHLVGAGWLPGLLGELVEWASPSVFWHELHAFAQKRA